MLYVNKKNKNEIVELLHSDSQVCVYVASMPVETDKDGKLVEAVVGEGVFFKGNKKEFKKVYKKASKKIQDTYTVLPEDVKDEVYGITLGDRYGLLNHSAEYVAGNIRLQEEEIAEFHRNQTEEEREQMLKDLRD